MIIFSDQWPFGLATLRTNDPSDQWPSGPMAFGRWNHWPSDYRALEPIFLRTNDPQYQRPLENTKRPFGLTTRRTEDFRTTGPIFRLMNLRTINLPDQWPFGLLAIPTHGTIFRSMTLRTTDLSDYSPFGPVHDFRTNEPSDQRPFGISKLICRSPGTVMRNFDVFFVVDLNKLFIK